jgi:hypothetical protein
VSCLCVAFLVFFVLRCVLRALVVEALQIDLKCLLHARVLTFPDDLWRNESGG